METWAAVLMVNKAGCRVGQVGDDLWRLDAVEDRGRLLGGE